MPPIADHPQRNLLANELHARPFPIVRAPGRAAYLALKPRVDAAGRDRDADMAHLIELLDHYGAQHPEPDATHYAGQIGRHFLKWESHTEFVTYTILAEGTSERPFDADTFALFPEAWLTKAPGVRITSALIRVETLVCDDEVTEKTRDWFVPESLATSRVLDDELVIAGDFRIDETGHMRFAVFARPEVNERRIGRVVQRLTEIETYKAMSMLGLSRARSLAPQINAIDVTLSGLLNDMSYGAEEPETLLQSLLDVSAELENVAAKTSYRFAATTAYERLVNQRIEILREARFEGRQTFSEFMMRRFDPAMRTVSSTQARLKATSDRAIRAGEMLRTRVDVERSAQSEALLTSMDRRSDLQLRLQRTVEGLSVVAISYYAVNLVLFFSGPLQHGLGTSKSTIAAIATPIVLLLVWLTIKRIHRQMD